MGQTLAVTRRNTRLLLGDMDPNNYVCSTPRLNRMIVNACNRLASDAGLGMQRVPNFATLAAGAYEVALAVNYQNVGELMLNEYRRPLMKVDPDAIDMMRVVTLPGRPSQGPTVFYCIMEQPDQTGLLRVHPIVPDGATYTYTAQLTPFPTEPTADTGLIQFEQPLLRALETEVAMEVLAGASQEDMARLNLSATLIPVWQQYAREGRDKARQRTVQAKLPNSVMMRNP